MIVSRVYWGSPTPETLHDYVGIPVATFPLGTALASGHLAEAGGTLPARLSTRVENRWTEIPVITAQIRGADEDFVMVTDKRRQLGARRPRQRLGQRLRRRARAHPRAARL